MVPVSVAKPETASVVRLRSLDGWEIELPGHSVPLLVDFLKHLVDYRCMSLNRKFAQQPPKFI